MAGRASAALLLKLKYLASRNLRAKDPDKAISVHEELLTSRACPSRNCQDQDVVNPFGKRLTANGICVGCWLHGVNLPAGDTSGRTLGWSRGVGPGGAVGPGGGSG